MPRLTSLKLIRLKLGLPLWRVAGEIGISSSAISFWENGAPCPEKWLKKLADFYGVPVEELLKEPEI